MCLPATLQEFLSVVDYLEQFGYFKHSAPAVLVACLCNGTDGGEFAQPSSCGVGCAACRVAEVFDISGGHCCHGFKDGGGCGVGSQVEIVPIGVHVGDGLGDGLGVVAGDLGGIRDVVGGDFCASGAYGAFGLSRVCLVVT